ncbi:MAG: WbqC family protein [Bacteroidales bacterium]
MHNRLTGLLLSTAYFPPIEYFACIGNIHDVFIEKHENYKKQSYRNRCNILSANGVLPLVIPVKRVKGKKTLITDIKPDYTCSWQKNHRISIESAYRSSPFYEYYIDEIKPFFYKEFTYLIDLNAAILEKLLPLVDLPANWRFTEQYTNKTESGIIDMRDNIHPKLKKGLDDRFFQPLTYYQVFSDRHGFQSNLSILDVIFNTGPDARSIIMNSFKIPGKLSF